MKLFIHKQVLSRREEQWSQGVMAAVSQVIETRALFSPHKDQLQ